MTTRQLFILNLRRLRKTKFRSQGDFAARVGLSERGYQKYEQGESHPTPDVLDRFAKVLGCSPVDLIADPKMASDRNNSGVHIEDIADPSARLLLLLDRDEIMKALVYALVLEDDSLIDALPDEDDALVALDALKKVRAGIGTP